MNDLRDQVIKIIDGPNPVDEILKLIHEESRDALAQGREFVEQAKIEYYNLGYKDAEKIFSKMTDVPRYRNNGKGLPAKRRNKLASSTD